MVWQLANESDCIRQPITISFADIDFSRQRIHRRKQPIFNEDVVPRERLEEARLPGVRVADERRRREIAAALALIGAMLGDVRKPLLDHGDLGAAPAAVRWMALPMTCAPAVSASRSSSSRCSSTCTASSEPLRGAPTRNARSTGD